MLPILAFSISLLLVAVSTTAAPTSKPFGVSIGSADADQQTFDYIVGSFSTRRTSSSTDWVFFASLLPQIVGGGLAGLTVASRLSENSSVSVSSTSPSPPHRLPLLFSSRPVPVKPPRSFPLFASRLSSFLIFTCGTMLLSAAADVPPAFILPLRRLLRSAPPGPRHRSRRRRPDQFDGVRLNWILLLVVPLPLLSSPLLSCSRARLTLSTRSFSFALDKFAGTELDWAWKVEGGLEIKGGKTLGGSSSM